MHDHDIRPMLWRIGFLFVLVQNLHAQSDPLAARYGGVSIWLALFALAVVGVFALYFSSEKIKTLTRNFHTMQETQREIETHHNVLLSVIGERIEASTQGLRRHREVFEEQAGMAWDPEVIRTEMTRFRRDESLLIDAMQDLRDFSRLRAGTFELEVASFGVSEMLKRLSQQVEPYYFLKRNELIYALDPQRVAYMQGDARRLEQILVALLAELGQELYDASVILSIEAAPESDRVVFGVQIPLVDDAPQMPDVLFGETGALPATQHTSRKLKNYIARELIGVMGGEVESVRPSDGQVQYRIMLPLRVQSARSTFASIAAPTLVVAHNLPTADSIVRMLPAVSPSTTDRHITGQTPLPELRSYTHVVISYAALQEEEWIDRLLHAQEERPLHLIVLKNPFERNLPIPQDLAVAQVLRMPLLPDKFLRAMTRRAETPLPSEAVAS